MVSFQGLGVMVGVGVIAQAELPKPIDGRPVVRHVAAPS
jgi:hypothetical protein